MWALRPRVAWHARTASAVRRAAFPTCLVAKQSPDVHSTAIAGRRIGCRGHDGYKEFLAALRGEVLAFRKPVAYVHGDSHYFRLEKPLLDAMGRRLENFTRVETFCNNAPNGNNDVQLKVLVNPLSREVFAYEPQIVPGNRVAVPAP